MTTTQTTIRCLDCNNTILQAHQPDPTITTNLLRLHDSQHHTIRTNELYDRTHAIIAAQNAWATLSSEWLQWEGWVDGH